MTKSVSFSLYTVDLFNDVFVFINVSHYLFAVVSLSFSIYDCKFASFSI